MIGPQHASRGLATSARMLVNQRKPPCRFLPGIIYTNIPTLNKRSLRFLLSAPQSVPLMHHPALLSVCRPLCVFATTGHGAAHGLDCIFVHLTASPPACLLS